MLRHRFSVLPPNPRRSASARYTALLLTALFTACFAVAGFAQHDAKTEPAAGATSTKTEPRRVKEKNTGKGYTIDVYIKGFEEKECYLGYHFGSKQYLLDTAKRAANGHYVFEDSKELDPGIYLLVMPPKNRYFEVLINAHEQTFSVETDTLDFIKNFKAKGSAENSRFYDYLNFISAQRTTVEPMQKRMAAAKDQAEKDKVKKELEAIDNKVVDYQTNITKNQAKSFTAAIIKASREPKIPDLRKKNGDVDTSAQFSFYRSHFWDEIDFSDSRLIRTPILESKWKRYVDDLTTRHPDSIGEAARFLIEKARKADNDVYKYFVTELLNYYAGSKIVGMDAVYVYIAKTYYMDKAWTPWVDADIREKIVNDATKLEPLLIGKIAPNIKMFKEDGSTIALNDVKSPYTILIFWDTECSHCQKSMPVVRDAYEKLKGKGVEVFSVCTRGGKDVGNCWKMNKEKGYDKWINVTDPNETSNYHTLYDIRSTPQVYVLNAQKEIISKKIGAEQFEEVIPKLIEMDQRRIADELKKGKKQ